MRYYQHFFLFLLAFFSATGYLLATHIVGGGITYEYLSDEFGGTAKRYRFTLKVYRDCQNGQAQFDNLAYINFYRGTYQNANTLFPMEVSLGQVRDIIITRPGCIDDLPEICLQEATYSFERTLPLSTESYFIAYQRCCRTAAIANVFSPSTTGATYFVEITRQAQQVNNSSPVFNNFPPPVICNGYPLEVDYAVTDTDGDQMVYSFCTSYSGGGQVGFSCDSPIPQVPCPPPFDQLKYTQPTYSALNPMGGNPKISIDPQSGYITGTPTHNGQYVVTVCVKEYREGALLSESRREFQFNVAPCAPQVTARVEHDSLAGPKRYIVRTCNGNKSLTLKNLSFSLPNIQSFRWEFDLKNGNTLVNSQDFDLTTEFPDYGSYDGTLVLNAGLSCGDTAYIRVEVLPKATLELGPDVRKCADEVTVLGPSVASGLHNLRWQDGSEAATYTVTAPGKYWLTGQDACGKLVTDTVEVSLDPDCLCPDGAFFKTLGHPDQREVGNVLCPTRDGHLYLSGLHENRTFLAKITPDGSVLWARDLTNGTAALISVTQILEDSEGMIVGVGTQGAVPDPTTAAIFRYDPTTHQVLWAKTLDAIDPQTASLIELGSGGNYVLNQNPSDNLDRRIEIHEIDRTSGNLVAGRSRLMAHATGLFANKMLLHQGAYYLAGWVHAGDSANVSTRNLVMKVDSALLEVDWTATTYTSLANQEASFESLDMVADQNALVSVFTGAENEAAGPFLLYLQKTALNGTVEWVKKYDLENVLPEEIVVVADGYLVLAHNYIDTRYLLKTDKEGNLLFIKQLEVNTASFPLLLGLLSSHHGQMVVRGDRVYLTSFDNYESGDVLLMNMDQDGSVSDSCGFFQAVPGLVTTIPPAEVINLQLPIINTPIGAAAIDLALVSLPFDLPATTICACGDAPVCDVTLDLGPDLILCSDTTVVLDAGAGFASYLWQDGSTERTFTASTFDIFHVMATDSCGQIFRDTILITRSLAGDIKLADTSLCPGQSVTLQMTGFDVYQWSPGAGLNCTDCSTVVVQPAVTTQYTLYALNAQGCSVRDTFTVTILPNPKRTQVIEFYPNQPVTLGGQTYTQPTTVTLTVPSATGGCDSIITYDLRLLPTQISAQCPANQVVTLLPGANGVVVNYATPTATTDCPGGATLTQLSGLESGGNFPAGVNTVCYEADNGCGNRDTCCFTVTVNTGTGPCDTKTIGCIRYDLLEIRFTAAGDRRYRIRVTNTCNSALSYVAFQLPGATSATSPAEGSVYTAAGSGNTYAVRNPNASPFHSIRFRAAAGDLLNGESDVFEYTLPPQAMPNYIQAYARLRDQTSYGTHLNTFYCPVQPWGGESSAPLSKALRAWPSEGLVLFPNPNTGVLSVAWAGFDGREALLQVWNAQGQLVWAQLVQGEVQSFSWSLPEHLANGLYYLSAQSANGVREVARFVLER